MDLKELGAVDPSTHWYYTAKLDALRAALERRAHAPQRIVDVGAGSGYFSMALARGRTGVGVVCVDPNYDDEALGTHGAVRFVRAPSTSDVVGADVFLFIDVLEHVDDDEALLSSYLDRATPGALVLITVPAFASMWSAHDEFLDHRRRYRREQVVEVARRAGLDVLDSRYLFGVIFPAAWVVRRARRSGAPESDLRPVAPLLNAALRSLASFEHRHVNNRVAGLSVLVVARVPARAT